MERDTAVQTIVNLIISNKNTALNKETLKALKSLYLKSCIQNNFEGNADSTASGDDSN